MRARLGLLAARAFPRGGLDAARQLALFALAFLAYRLVRGAVHGRSSDAFEHARELISLEQSLHAFVEPAVQAWAASQGWLLDCASWLYVNTHFTITFAALVFIYSFHNRSFYFVRNMFLISMGLALVGYFLYPTAPPRFLPEWGFEDSVAAFTGVTQDSVAVNALFNPYAAVPSMHVAFALMLGLPLAQLVRSRLLKGAWLCYPLLVTFVVVVTGNHFWMDAVLGGLTAAVSGYAAHGLLARARPQAWGFRPAPAEATT